MKRTAAIILILIILAGFARFTVLFNSDNYPGNHVDQVIHAIRIHNNPDIGLNFGGNTSMLYNYLLAGVLHFWYDPLLSPRIFTVIFGIFIIIPYYFLIELLFGKRIAFYSAILLSLDPLHVIQSGLTTADVVFHFFIFSCLYYFFKFQREEKPVSALILSAILFNIASMLRFESWIFIPFLFILLYRHNKKYSVIFLSIALILPSLWLYLCHYYNHNAFYSFIKPGMTAHAEIVSRIKHSRQIFGWLNVLYVTLGRIVLVSGVCGMIYSFVKKRFIHLALPFLFLLSLYTASSLMDRMWYNERYSIFLGLLMLPYSVLCIGKISGYFKLKPLLLFLPFIFFSAAEFKNIGISRLPIQSKDVKQIAVWLKTNAKPSDIVILGSDKWDMNHQDIILRSAIPPENFFVVLAFNTPVAITKEDVRGFIIGRNPRYLILNTTGYLQEILKFDMYQKKINEFGYVFEAVYSKDTVGFKRFNIYEIHYI